MFGANEASGSGFHPIMAVEKGHDGDRQGWGAYLWAVVIFIVFIFVVFIIAAMFLRRDDKHHGNIAETLTPLIAANAMNHKPYYDGHGNYEHWDIVRDELREFGNLKYQGAENAWKISAENAKYFYEQQKTNLLGFKDVEILGLKNTAETVKEVRSVRCAMS
jgi:hypothetical protein